MLLSHANRVDQVHVLTMDNCFAQDVRDRLRFDPALAGVLASLKDRLLTFFLETGDVVPHETDRRDPIEPSFGP